MRSPRNPYIVGPPLRDKDSFFGRQEIIAWVMSEFTYSHVNSLVLFGQRRIGKTTLLLQIANALASENFLPIYFDLQDQASKSLSTVLHKIASRTAKAIQLRPPKPECFDNEGDYFCEKFLPRLYKSLKKDQRPVFLLDEFDAIDQHARVGLPEYVAANALFPFLHRIMNDDPIPAFIFVVGRQTDDLNLDCQSVFKTSLMKEIWVLDDESARSLVRQAEVNKTLLFTEGAIARIIELTGKHPYLTQLLCQGIWACAYENNPSQIPHIDAERVNEAIAATLEAGGGALEWLWNGLSSIERIYASALAEAYMGDNIISEESVIQVLGNHADRLRTYKVQTIAPRDLVKRRVLLGDETGYYFAIRLFQEWVRNNKPLDNVKEELDKLDPLADQIYNLGVEYFHRHKWHEATKRFEDALEKNKDHFRARLYLGEALL